LIVALGGIVLIAMGILIWTGELFRINIEIQKWMSELGLDFWSEV
jgi:cytochrome c-type biogenesis protein